MRYSFDNISIDDEQYSVILEDNTLTAEPLVFDLLVRNVERIKLVMRFLADVFMKDEQWQVLAREA